jgi:hypothetical protein
MKILLMLLLLLPQLAAARVFMCVDPATGKTSLTDRGCSSAATTEELRVPAVNVNSGSNTGTAAPARTWISDRDTRKTGREYSATQRSGTAASAAIASGVQGGAEGS